MSTITFTQFKTDIYSRDVQLPELASDAVFFSLFKRAVVNVRTMLSSAEPSAFETWLEDQTSPVTFPADLNQDLTTLVFPAGEYKNPIAENYISTRNGKWYVDSYATFNIKYPNDIAVFTSLTDTFPFKMEKCQEILISEMMALINAAYEENEAPPSVTNAITQSNRIQ